MAVAFGPDDQWLATAAHDPDHQGTNVRLWERATGLPVSGALSCPERLTSLAFADGGDYLLGFNQDHAYRWKLELPSQQRLAQGVERRLRATLNGSGAVVPR